MVGPVFILVASAENRTDRFDHVDDRCALIGCNMPKRRRRKTRDKNHAGAACEHAEQGYPGFQAVVWRGVLAPAGTPKEVVNKINEALRTSLSQPDET